MVSKLFVDTDVIIDHLTDRSPFANQSSIIFEMHEQNKIKIHISSMSVNNVHYISRKIIGDKASKNLIEKLIDNLEIVGTTKKEIKQAFRSGISDFEDSIQHATAMSVAGIEAIITRNIKDYRKSKIAVFSPEIYLKTQLKEE